MSDQDAARTATADDGASGVSRFAPAFVRGLVRVARRVVVAGAICWTTLALHFSNLPWSWLRTGSALAFLIFAVWALRGAQPRRFIALGVVFSGVLCWWMLIPASHDRRWAPEVAVMPRVELTGDHARISGVRCFSYRSRNEFTAHYETRTYDLARLTGVDFYVSYWVVGPMAHTFLSFTFADDTPPLCISIEARPEEGRAFAVVPTFFKQFHLIYVVGDERDLVGVRTHHRDETVFRYPIRVSPPAARALCRHYLDRINGLAERPEFYHLLSNSCTVNIVEAVRDLGHPARSSVRLLLNGYVDRYLYDHALIDTTRPFTDVRAAARLDPAVIGSPDAPEFSRRLRASDPDVAGGGSGR